MITSKHELTSAGSYLIYSVIKIRKKVLRGKLLIDYSTDFGCISFLYKRQFYLRSIFLALSLHAYSVGQSSKKGNVLLVLVIALAVNAVFNDCSEY